MTAAARILIVVNKFWECDPVCGVLTGRALKDSAKVSVPWPVVLTYPSCGPVQGRPFRPRMVFAVGPFQIELWCISDLLSVFPDTSEYQSSSECKMEVLPDMFRTGSPLPVALTVAVGTASAGPFCPPWQGEEQVNVNGSVIVGSRVYIHDPYQGEEPNPHSRWSCTYFDTLMSSGGAVAPLIEALAAADPARAFLVTPTNPAPAGPRLYANPDYVALADVNVTDHTLFAEMDRRVGEAFRAGCPGNSGGVSLETTHGLIYAAARDHLGGDPPFLFVSGIVNRYLLFGKDVAGNAYPQNFTGAHNAGVVAARLIATLAENPAVLG